MIPISFTQDAVGAMGRTVRDLARALTVMASVGYHARENVTAGIPAEAVGTDYVAGLRGDGLKGLRLGLVQGFSNWTASEETTPVNEAMVTMVSKLQGIGVEVVNISETIYNSTAISAAFDVQSTLR